MNLAMLKLDGEEALFSLKCFVAAMLAFYVALSIGLSRPFWAVTTSYIVAQPLAGAVLSKAVFRLGGTALGATAAILLVPTFVNEPLVLSAALASWLGLCLYIALLDRTPRAYTFLLAGYTASIIGFPSVDVPGTIFTTAILRVQEIVIGILCGSLIHGFVFPRTVTKRLLSRIDAILADAERWTREALHRVPEARRLREERRLALDLGELDQLAIHLPFDTARILPRVRTVRALQDQLLLILPYASAVEDRLAALRETGGVPGEISDLLAEVDAWLIDGVRQDDRDITAERLRARALPPGTTDDPALDWRDMLTLNLQMRIADLIGTHRDARNLRDQINSHSVRAISPHVATLLAHASSRALHRDRGLALRSALGTFACIMIGCLFWISTAWADGAGAVLISGICCALFGNVDRPGPVIFTFLIGSTIGLIVALFYAYAIMPRVTSFEMLALVMAPPLLIVGSMIPRPQTVLLALGMVVGFVNPVGFTATYSSNFSASINGLVAQIAGTGFAVICVSLFQTVGVEHSVARLFRAGWRDVARRAAGRDRNDHLWGSRMLDRIGLLLPRLAARGQDESDVLLDALVDMRIGVVAGQLYGIGPGYRDDERAHVAAALDGVRRHFLALDPRRPVPPSPELLIEIDRGVAAFAADPEPARRREGLVLLTSLRRNLFPTAPGYRMAA